jgi:hypothetical protein
VTAARYRKKPVVVDAIQFTGENHAEVVAWATSYGGQVTAESATCYGDGPPFLIIIRTLEGTMAAGRDDWLIRGTHGEFYPCKPEPFADTFEVAE